MPIFTIYEYRWELVRYHHEIEARSVGQALCEIDDLALATCDSIGIDMRDSIQVELDGVDHNDQPHVQILDYTEREAVFDRRGWYGVREEAS
jgi:hypothetical protein